MLIGTATCLWSLDLLFDKMIYALLRVYLETDTPLVVEAFRLEGYDNGFIVNLACSIVVEAFRLEGYDNSKELRLSFI